MPMEPDLRGEKFKKRLEEHGVTLPKNPKPEPRDTRTTLDEYVKRLNEAKNGR